MYCVRTRVFNIHIRIRCAQNNETTVSANDELRQQQHENVILRKSLNECESKDVEITLAYSPISPIEDECFRYRVLSHSEIS